MNNAPIMSLEELEEASPRRIGYQIRWELSLVLKRPEVESQEHLGLHLLDRDNTIVSHWKNGRKPLPARAAKQFDELFGDTSLGITWAKLVDAREQAIRRHGRDAMNKGDIFDVFLASPMAAAWDLGTYQEERRRAMAVADTLRLHGFSTTYAGQSISDESSFDVPDLAAEMNFDALRECRYFLLLYAVSTDEQTPPAGETVKPRAPSSVWVEAGYALACRRPSVYVIRDTLMLPYCLRDAGLADPGSLLPPVLVHHIRDSSQAEPLMRSQGPAIFKKLDALARRR